MPTWIPDLVITLAILGMTYVLASEGAFGAALVVMNLIFAILVALNFYEPLAKLVADNASFMAGFADMVCLGLLFLVTYAILKFSTEALTPTQVRLPSIVALLGRIGFGALGATILVAFMLVLLNTAPVHHVIGGNAESGIDHDKAPPWGWGIDRKLLGFFQYSTGATFPWYEEGHEDPVYGSAKIFDHDGAWLAEHQKARPFGEDPLNTTAAAPTPILDVETGEVVQ